ncbi:MAG: LysE family transporter [Candidatus Thorarchaeota archaeon]|nr:LysE family transporter [Candidatus Thorarchaeota archaeon]
MAAVEILVGWFILSLTGALAPGPLSAAVVMQTNKRGKLHGILPIIGHAIVEIGIIAVIILSVQLVIENQLVIDFMKGGGGFVIILFGLLALREYRYNDKSQSTESEETMSAATAAEATIQGALVSILSPYFLLWWIAAGFTAVSSLMESLDVGTVFLAGVLVYLVHISTDLLFGVILVVGTDKASKKAKVGGINWISVVIGLFQIAIGGLFLGEVIIRNLLLST